MEKNKMTDEEGSGNTVLKNIDEKIRYFLNEKYNLLCVELDDKTRQKLYELDGNLWHLFFLWNNQIMKSTQTTFNTSLTPILEKLKEKYPDKFEEEGGEYLFQYLKDAEQFCRKKYRKMGYGGKEQNQLVDLDLAGQTHLYLHRKFTELMIKSLHEEIDEQELNEMFDEYIKE